MTQGTVGPEHESSGGMGCLLKSVCVLLGLIVGAAAGVAIAVGLTAALMLLNTDNGIAGMLFLPLGCISGSIGGVMLVNRWASKRR